jgi:threonine aldolase
VANQIDLRSDTVTLPSPEMRAVMAQAAVGDDVYGEDPSVNELEDRAADIMGKPAAVYVPSGTMGNLCAHLAHTTPGQEVICSVHSHTFVSEAAGAARVGMLSMHTLPQERAELDPALVEAAIRQPDIHHPKTGLIWVEQPTRGYVMDLDNLAAIAAVARRHQLPVHMDGARIFNASVYLDVPVATIAAHVDSVMFCISKGLAAPVGSLLVGPADFIERARVARKLLGGSMRQAGIVAAAGLYALDHASAQLAEDHANARRLADGMRRLPALVLDRDEVQTNIFFADLVSERITPAQFVAALQERAILVSAPRGTSRRLRFATHYGISREHIQTVLDRMAEILQSAGERAGPRARIAVTA